MCSQGTRWCTLALALTCIFPLTHVLERSLNTQPQTRTFSHACACFCSDFTRRLMLIGSRSHPISDFLTNPLIHCPSLSQPLPSPHIYLKKEMHFQTHSLCRCFSVLWWFPECRPSHHVGLSTPFMLLICVTHLSWFRGVGNHHCPPHNVLPQSADWPVGWPPVFVNEVMERSHTHFHIACGTFHLQKQH